MALTSLYSMYISVIYIFFAFLLTLYAFGVLFVICVLLYKLNRFVGHCSAQNDADILPTHTKRQQQYKLN